MGFKLEVVVVVSAIEHRSAFGLLQTRLIFCLAGLRKADEHGVGQVNIEL
jgi:hypothetical protein